MIYDAHKELCLVAQTLRTTVELSNTVHQITQAGASIHSTARCRNTQHCHCCNAVSLLQRNPFFSNDDVLHNIISGSVAI